MKLYPAVVIAALSGSIGLAHAQPSPAASPIAPAPLDPATPLPDTVVESLPFALPPIHIHGFVSEGAFVSTANDYIGHSSRGSLEFAEAALNVSTELTDQLHVGMQFFSQDEGTANDPTPHLDWAFIDYHWKRWLGIRAGRVRIPFGLYNEYIDIDSARLQILLPQSVYPISDRTVLTAQTGALIYGNVPLRNAGELDYQLYAGALSTTLSGAQDATANRIYAIDSKYVAGGALFWRPVDGLRIGGSVLRASFDEYINLAPASITELIALGLAPPGFDGKVIFAARPANFWVTSAEYIHGDWLFATEYSRWFLRTPVIPQLVPTTTSDAERFYAMLTYRLSDKLDSGVYYSVHYADLYDPNGRNVAKFTQPVFAWQRDAAATVRYDLNDHWLVKLEGHFIDGAADLDTTLNPMPKRYWGMFLARTTVTF